MNSAEAEWPQGKSMCAGWSFWLASPEIILSHRPQGMREIWSKSHEAKVQEQGTVAGAQGGRGLGMTQRPELLFHLPIG